MTRAGATAESFLAFWLRSGRLAAAAGIGAAKDLRAAKSLIEARAHVPPAVLADQRSSLRALARSAAGHSRLATECALARG